MASLFIILNIILILSSSVLQARFQVNSKRRYSMSTKSFQPPPLPFDDDDVIYASDDDSLTELSIRTAPPTLAKNRASEQQVEQFTRLLFERLNLKEPPNVTMKVSDGTGIPSSIVKQFGQPHMRHHEEEDSFQKQKHADQNQPTTERAILPATFIPPHTCQRQLAVKYNMKKESANNIDCFLFTKSSMPPKGLPNNQVIEQLRIYVKKNYFDLIDQYENILTPDMFQIYQVFRPTFNDTSPKPFHSLTGTIRLPISEVKKLSDNWYELTIDPKNDQISIEQIYKQFIAPWFGLGMSHELEVPSTWSSLYRRYYSKKNLDDFLRSDADEDNGKESQQHLPYMLVEYGDKIRSSSSGNRGTRGVRRARPAESCNRTSPCCRHELIIDFDERKPAFDFIIYPRKIDIGECIGFCGASGSSLKHVDVKNAQRKNEANAAYNLFVLHYTGVHSHKNTSATQMNKGDERSTHCCSYSRTGGIDMTFTMTNGGPAISRFIPNMIVEECKCGLPATI